MVCCSFRISCVGPPSAGAAHKTGGSGAGGDSCTELGYSGDLLFDDAYTKDPHLAVSTWSVCCSS